MRAAVVERYGPPEVVTLREVPKPAPGKGEVLVRARATTVNSGDARVRGIHVPGGPVFAFLMRLNLGFSGPKQPIGGFEMAGEVEAVGPDVTAFKPGASPPPVRTPTFFGMAMCEGDRRPREGVIAGAVSSIAARISFRRGFPGTPDVSRARAQSCPPSLGRW